MLAGIRYIWIIVWKKVLKSFRQEIWNLYNGFRSIILWGSYSDTVVTTIKKSSLFTDKNWPSMKQIFRLLFKKREYVLNMKEFY